MPVHSFNPEKVPVPPPTYRQVAVTDIPAGSRLVTLAGQTGLRSDGTVPKGIVAQAIEAYDHVFEALKAAGASPKDIVFTRHYIVKDTGDVKDNDIDVVDRGWGDEWIKWITKHGEGNLPPDTVLGVACLAKKALLYEVECLAVMPAATS